jgi:pimeloyl-ACP methyl ester carboxylesterase
LRILRARLVDSDQDRLVKSTLHARALAATLPCAKLVLLKDIGHMPHHAAPEVVATAIDELLPSSSMSFAVPTPG